MDQAGIRAGYRTDDRLTNGQEKGQSKEERTPHRNISDANARRTLQQLCSQKT